MRVENSKILKVSGVSFFCSIKAKTSKLSDLVFVAVLVLVESKGLYY